LAPPVIERTGSCPGGWRSTGGYCVAGSSARGVKFKAGPCPTGWTLKGRYCFYE
jgi:hypothetical protein